MENLVARGLRDFRGVPHDSLVGRTSNREKHLDKFFKNFVFSVLATCSWLDSVAKIMCFAQIGQFLARTFVTVHCLPHINSFLNSLCHSHKPLLLLHFNFKSSRKMYGFSLSHYIFLVLSIIFLNLWVVFSIGFLGVSIMGWIIFVEFDCMSLVVMLLRCYILVLS